MESRFASERWMSIHYKSKKEIERECDELGKDRTYRVTIYTIYRRAFARDVVELGQDNNLRRLPLRLQDVRAEDGSTSGEGSSYAI